MFGTEILQTYTATATALHGDLHMQHVTAVDINTSSL